MDDESRSVGNAVSDSQDISRFTDSYESFNRIVNSLQRKYLELKEEFTAQNEELAEANRKLVDLTQRNLVATEFLNGILNSISAGVIAVDRDGRVTHFNPAASVILGIPLKVPPGRHYRDVIPPGSPVDANALRSTETGREIDSIEKRMELTDGTRLQLSVSTAIIRDSEGHPNGAVEVFQDLTKIKKMEQEIARLNTLAALGEMAATIAHEVRNPLSGIGGFAALLERDLGDDDTRRKLVRKIIRGVDSLNETVETLLNYTRFEEIKREDVNYEDFVKGTMDQFRIDNSSRIQDIRMELVPNNTPSSEPIILNIDQMLFRQIFFNLYSNAVDSLDGKGEIRVQARRLPRQKAVSLYADRVLLGVDDTVVETIVCDNGPGIEQEHIDRIFAPFFTTKREGSGLGLAVAWKIAKAHGGEMFAENAAGRKGARFYLLIPTRIDSVDMEPEQ